MTEFHPPQEAALVCMDSGVGGLAVLKRFIQVMPQHPYVFLGDTAWMPYGEKSLDVVQQRVLDVHDWLHTHHPISVFVLACNTAAVAAYDSLIQQAPGYPILGPVKTTANWANQRLPAGCKIGILATPATVQSNRYGQFLESHFQVKQIACFGLASLIESGVSSGSALDEVLLPYLNPLLEWGVETLILGCTHYSLIRDPIQAYIGSHITLIDSAEVLALEALPIIRQQIQSSTGAQQLLVTGNTHAFQKAIEALPLEELKGQAVSSVTIPTDCHVMG